MPRRNTPKDIKEIDDLNRLNEIIHDKRNHKRSVAKKSRRDRHYEKQFIKNTIQNFSNNKEIMTEQEIIERLKPIVKPFVKDIQAFEIINKKTHFINDLNINSANLVDIVLDVEEVFSIEIDNESMEKMLDLEQTIAVIQSKLNSK